METRGTRASAIVSPSDEDIITGLYVSYNGPHFYCWSRSWAQLKVNRSGLTRDDQAGPSHSSGRSESLTGLGVQGWSPGARTRPVWTNQRQDSQDIDQSEARIPCLNPRSGQHQTRGQAWTSANICSKYFSFSTEFYEISF